jgi:hypothetical protein
VLKPWPGQASLKEEACFVVSPGPSVRGPGSRQRHGRRCACGRACRACGTRSRRRPARLAKASEKARHIFFSIESCSRKKRRGRFPGNQRLQRSLVWDAAVVHREHPRGRLRHHHETRGARGARDQGGVPDGGPDLSSPGQILASAAAPSGSAHREKKPNRGAAGDRARGTQGDPPASITSSSTNRRRRSAGTTLPAVDDLEAIVRAERFRITHYDDDTFRNVENA